MRVHPISLALQYLKGRRSWSAAPYHGGAPFRNEASAVATLKRLTGQDFGREAKAWGAWLRRNRAVYRWQRPPARRRGGAGQRSAAAKRGGK
jgi:hypothetical protein